MDFSLLQSWLRLPPGPWPPDYYTLLGLAAGDTDMSRVEPRVMERMEILRRHQLRNPELVTAGMNLLAQALVCLTDGEEKAAYDRKQCTVEEVVPPPPPPEPVPFMLPETVFDVDEARSVDAPEVQDATVVLEVPFTAGLEPPLALSEDEKSAHIPRHRKPVAVVEAKVVEGAASPVSNRWIYRRLAVVRRCLRGWDQLAPVLATPDEWLDRPAQIFPFLQAVLEIRPLSQELRPILDDSGGHGLIALAVVSQAVPTDMVRTLLPGQRAKLAVDWRRGRNAIILELTRLRSLSHRPRGFRGAKFLRSIVRRLASQPVVLLVAISLFALVIAAFRSSVPR